jgi:hypothetical protein
VEDFLFFNAKSPRRKGAKEAEESRNLCTVESQSGKNSEHKKIIFLKAGKSAPEGRRTVAGGEAKRNPRTCPLIFPAPDGAEENSRKSE